MDGAEQMVAVRWAFRDGQFVLRTHAHVEMLLEGLATQDIRRAGSDSDLLEEYPERPQGRTQLLLGHARPGKPVHLVVNVAAFEDDFSEPIAVVTVYEPEPPEWMDERTRGGQQP